MLYQLMNKDRVVATCRGREDVDDFHYDEVAQLDGHLPYGFSYADLGLEYPSWKLDAANWLKERQVSAILG